MNKITLIKKYFDAVFRGLFTNSLVLLIDRLIAAKAYTINI